MEKKLTKIVAILTLAGLMAAGPVVYAESDGNNPWDNPGNNPGGGNPGNAPGNGSGPQLGTSEGFLERFNLTLEQREKFRALEESDKVMAEQIKKKTQELDAVVAELGTTRSDADYLIDEISTLQAKVLSQKMDRLFALKKILTPEQFEKMQEQNKGPANPNPGGFGGQNPGPGQN